jgi:23S rRNA (guanosine2251-2'-O)-methyltransferase
VKLRLVVTRNALDRLGEAVPAAGLSPRSPIRASSPCRSIPAPSTRARRWRCGRSTGALDNLALADGPGAPRLVLLDRVSDPHNVGAILRSAEVFGARAVVAPARHSAPETGALAKTASGALERQPYLRVPNLGNAIETLKGMGYLVIGLDGEGPVEIAEGALQARGRPAALVLGAEGPGLRARTRDLCDVLARIPAAGGFGSLNVSNAAAVSLYA